MQSYLDECRSRFQRSAGTLGFLKDKLGKHRSFNADTAGDAIPPKLIVDYHLLLREGRIVWACIAQANSRAFLPGDEDLPSNTVYSDDPFFAAEVEELYAIARAVYALKGTRPAAAALAQVAAMITDEYNFAMHEPLPDELTQGRAVYFSTTILHRRRLPTNYLVESWFPLLICPEKTRVNMILPLNYWSPRLTHWWQQKEAQTRVERQAAGGSRRADAPPQVGVPACDELGGIERYRENPVTLTDKAAAKARDYIAQYGKLNQAYLRVSTRNEGGITYHVELSDAPLTPSESELQTESRGIRIVTDAASAPALAGMTLDFQETPFEDGFIFLP